MSVRFFPEISYGGVAGFRGTWVPATAAGTSPFTLVIEVNVITWVNGTQRVAYRQ